MSCIKSLIIATALFGLGLGTSVDAFATTFEDSIDVKPGTFDNFINGADDRSFDGTGTSALGAFDAFVNAGEYIDFGIFDVATTFEAQLLFEMTAYDDLNEFGVLDETGGFTSLIVGSDVAGSSRTVDIAAGGSNRLAVRSPDGTFSSVDSDNTNGLSYVIGQRILQDGFVKLFGNEFAVTAGQFVVYFEDLAGAMPQSDQDYNDGVLLLTVTEVPEPATLSLLLAGLGGLKLRRKKQS